LSDGGSPLLDYEVWWDLGAGNDVFELVTDTTSNTLEFTQDEAVVTGGYYIFKVVSVNVIGRSDFSE
jgi:hypothetical protein